MNVNMKHILTFSILALVVPTKSIYIKKSIFGVIFILCPALKSRKIVMINYNEVPIPVAGRSRSCVCSRSFIGTAGPIIAGGVVSVCSDCCV